MSVHEIENWSDLAGLIKQQFKEGWIYRGVRNSNDNLIPRIGRKGSRKTAQGLELPYDFDEEKRLLRQFKREARSQYEWEPKTDLEWMILGQHHLLPTRLLDWSESLLVAVYFAVEELDKEAEYCAVYGVKPPEEIESLDVDPFSHEVGISPRLIRPPHITPRITAQKGVLTIHPNPEEPWDNKGIHCWRISTAKNFTFKGILDFCGIHAASLFPDSADRHTEHLKWLHRWGRLSG